MPSEFEIFMLDFGVVDEGCSQETTREYCRCQQGKPRYSSNLDDTIDVPVCAMS